MKSLFIAAFLLLTTTAAQAQNWPSTNHTHQHHQTAHTAQQSGVVVNGVMLTEYQALQLDYMIGMKLPAGRYYIDAWGNFGIEGYPPAFNLMKVVEARMRQQGNYQSQYGQGGEIVHSNEYGYYSKASNGEWGMSVGGCTVINGDVSC